MIAENRETLFCSRQSLAGQEQVFATASPVQVWFLLQYAYPWATEPFPAARLPEAVNQRFGELGNKTLSKLLLIRQAPREGGPLTFFVGINNMDEPRLYRFRLDSYDELLDIDIEGLLADETRYEPLPPSEHLLLVCTHGTHDRCCAKYGLAVFREAAHAAGGAAWQCSHVGGDRFAANLLLFPHGLYYGHVERDEVTEIIAAYEKGRIYPARYRGRSCYAMPVQAADFFLRLQTNDMGLHSFRPVGVTARARNRWEVRFIATVGDLTYTLEVERNDSILSGYASCKATTKTTVPQYRLLRCDCT